MQYDPILYTVYVPYEGENKNEINQNVNSDFLQVLQDWWVTFLLLDIL